MRDFTDIQRELGLRRFLQSPLGTLHAVPVTRENPHVRRLMVRHFDSELPPALVKPFAELIQGAQRWVERHPAVDGLVSIEQPVEIGRDFIVRKYHMYHASTDAYVDWEDPPEPPVELERMRNAFRVAMGKSPDPRDSIIETVLARSLLEPSGKTYFSESKGRFVVVEPKPTREELERWATLTASATD